MKKIQKFSIRKTTFGVGSILIGSFLLGNVASAEEVTLEDGVEFVGVEDVFEETGNTEVDEKVFDEFEYSVEDIADKISYLKSEEFEKAKELLANHKHLVEPLVKTAVDGTNLTSFVEKAESTGVSKAEASEITSKPIAEVLADDNLKGTFEDGSDIIVANILEGDITGSTSVEDGEAEGRDIIFLHDTSGSMYSPSDRENGRTVHQESYTIFKSILEGLGSKDRIGLIDLTYGQANFPVVNLFSGWKDKDYYLDLDKSGVLSDILIGNLPDTGVPLNKSTYAKDDTDTATEMSIQNSGYRKGKLYTFTLVDDWAGSSYLPTFGYSGGDIFDPTLGKWLKDNAEVNVGVFFIKNLLGSPGNPEGAGHKSYEEFTGGTLYYAKGMSDEDIVSLINENITPKTTTTYKPLTVNIDTKGLGIEKLELIKPDGSKTPIQNGHTFTPDADGKYKVRYVLKGTAPESTTTYTGKLVEGTRDVSTRRNTYEVADPVVEEKEETETQLIPFTKETRNNPNLPKGQKKVVQQGKDGVKTIYYTVTITDGERGERRKVREAVTTEPTPEITEIGTQPIVNSTEETETQPIPFTKETRDNPELPKGQTRVVQQGKDGIKTIYYSVTTTDGQRGERVKVREEITTPPTPEITEIGSKPIVTTTNSTETEAIPFTSEVRNNPNMNVGETKLIQKGIDGVRTHYYETTVTDGVDGGRRKIRDEVTTLPTPEIIEVGTRSENNRTETQPVPNKTVHKKTFDLMKGETREDIGHLGIRVIVYRDVMDGGKLVSTEEVSNNITKEPVDTVIWEGTKEIKNRTEKHEIPNKRVKKKTADLLVGETRIMKGRVGEYVLTYEEIWDGDKLVSSIPIKKEETIKPVDEIEWIGVKEFKERTETTEILYETKEVENEELPKGEKKLKQTGVSGKLTTTYKELWIDGKLQRTEKIKEEKLEPIDEIFEVGTKEPEPEKESEECPVPMPVGELPATGESENYLMFSGATLSILASVGLLGTVKKKRRGDL